MSAILTFLGGSAFRMAWGEISSWLTKRQEHKIEMERLQVQGQLDTAQHARNLDSLRVQAELGVKTIQVQGEMAANQADADAFRAAMVQAATPSGIKWVDAWNACVRPAFATAVLLLWMLALHRRDWTPTEWDLSLMGSIVGFFFADRTLRRRSK